MAKQFSYGYIKEAVKAHLDLEEDELEVLQINQRLHIFANEAIQQICFSKPKYLYFQFKVISAFTPLVYDNGVIRVATIEEQNWVAHGLTEPIFTTAEETAIWYNEQGIYLIGQVVDMPSDFLSFAVKKAFIWTDSIYNRQVANSTHFTHLSNHEIVPYYVATYQIPYQATWLTFTQDAAEDELINMPSDLLLTIPIYIASVCLQQRNLNLAQAKRQEFELAVSRCKSINFLENISVTPTFK